MAKRSTISEAIMAGARQLSDEQLAQIIKNTPGWRGAVEPLVEKEQDYSLDPVIFAEHNLGLKLWDRQVEVVSSLKYHRRVVVESGHGVGKSVAAAILTAWWLSYHKQDAKVITIAPTFAQVAGILWRYIRHYARANHLPGVVFETPRWEVATDRFAIGLSPRKQTQEDVVSLQGYHAENLLVIMDEAAGIPKILWDAIESLAVSNNNRILTIGNPIEQSGPFWDACKSDSWHHIQISCLEHPNITERREVVPGAVSWDWVNDRIKEWCTPCESGMGGAIEWNGSWFRPMPIFEAKVLGRAPEQSDFQLIRISWIDDAVRREAMQSGEVIIALDPARYGSDESVMCARAGEKVLWLKDKRDQNSMQLAAWLRDEAVQLDAIKVYVDAAGIGAGVYDQARAFGLPVTDINWSRQAQQKKRFANQRAEFYWRLREALRTGKIGIPNNALLHGDLAAIRVGYDQFSRILIEDKDQLRKRIGRSPDSGDALAMTYAMPTSGEVDIEELQSALTGEWGRDYTDSGGKWVIDKPARRSRWRK